MKVRNLRSGFPAWGPKKGLGIPREFRLKGQWDLITRLLQDWKRTDLGGHKQTLVHTNSRKGAVSPQETEPKLRARIGGSPVEAQVEGLTMGTEGLTTAVWGKSLWRKPSQRLPSTQP